METTVCIQHHVTAPLYNLEECFLIHYVKCNWARVCVVAIPEKLIANFGQLYSEMKACTDSTIREKLDTHAEIWLGTTNLLEERLNYEKQSISIVSCGSMQDVLIAKFDREPTW